MSGWIKFHRQVLTNGHFHMPDRAFKVWLYILLSASHKDLPAAELRAGEAWISYEQIARDCGEAGRQMRREAVARVLTWLEEHGYIRRLVVKGRGQNRGGAGARAVLWPEDAADLGPQVAPGRGQKLIHDGSAESERAAGLAPELAPELAAELKQEDQEREEEGGRRSTSSPAG